MKLTCLPAKDRDEIFPEPVFLGLAESWLGYTVLPGGNRLCKVYPSILNHDKQTFVTRTKLVT